MPHVTNLGLCLLRQMRLCLRFLLLLRSRRPLRLLRLRPLLLRLLLLPPLLLLLLSPRLLSLVLLSLVLLLLLPLPVLHRVRRWHFVPPPLQLRCSLEHISHLRLLVLVVCERLLPRCLARLHDTFCRHRRTHCAPQKLSIIASSTGARCLVGLLGLLLRLWSVVRSAVWGCIRRRGRHDGAARRARLLAL